MRTPKTKPLPPRKEWDFRQIDDLALPSATVWEYCRSNPEIRQRVTDWLHTEVDGDTLGNHLFKAYKKTEPWQAHRAMDLLSNTVHDALVYGWTSGQVPADLWNIITSERPDFPQPWLSLPMEYRKNKGFKRVLLSPLQDTLSRAISNSQRWGEETPAYLSKAFPTGKNFVLAIDWDGHTVEEILSDLESVIRKEAKKHPELRRGKRAQAQTDKLKWLSALRIKEAGFTYEQAHKALEQFNDSGRLIPVYKDKSGWSRAIADAKRELRKLSSNRP